MEVREDISQVDVARFPLEDRRGPGLVVVNTSRQIQFTSYYTVLQASMQVFISRERWVVK